MSIATALDTTSGDDPCIVYGDDYDGFVRLACESISDRIVAPDGASALAVAAAGPLKQMVRFHNGTYALEYFTTDGGTPTVPEPIEQDIRVSALSLAVDSTGTPHLAYHVEVSSSPGAYLLEVRYATLTPSGWQIETIASETADSAEQGKGSVSLALDPYGQPSIAYHRRSTRSLEIVTRESGSFSAPVVLDSPQPSPGLPGRACGQA